MYNSYGFVQFSLNTTGCTKVSQSKTGRLAFAVKASYIQFASLQLISLKSILSLSFHLRLSFLSLNYLHPRNRVLPENLTISQLVKTFPAVCGNQRFVFSIRPTEFILLLYNILFTSFHNLYLQENISVM